MNALNWPVTLVVLLIGLALFVLIFPSMCRMVKNAGLERLRYVHKLLDTATANLVMVREVLEDGRLRQNDPDEYEFLLVELHLLEEDKARSGLGCSALRVELALLNECYRDLRRYELPDKAYERRLLALERSAEREERFLADVRRESEESAQQAAA